MTQKTKLTVSGINIDFLIIGVQKSATSWLYLCLKEHPEVVVPYNKKEYAYIGSRTFFEKGELWYKNRFPKLNDSSFKVGEVAVDYMIDHNAPKVIKQYNDNPKIIVSLRNPVDRLISAYYWKVRRAQIPDEPINEVLSQLIKDRNGLITRENEDELHDIIYRGFYDEHLEAYMDIFNKENFLFLLYDEIVDSPSEIIKKVYKFIGVNDDFEPNSLNERPKVNTYNKLMIKLERILKLRMLGKLPDLINRYFLNKKFNDKPKININLYHQLKELYTPHLERTEKLIKCLPNENRPNTIDLLGRWCS